MKLDRIFIAIAVLVFISCGEEPKPERPQPIPVQSETEAKPPRPAPEFNADSAYHFISKQVGFGPRIPNTEPHRECGNYLVSKLESYGFLVIRQEAKVKAYTGRSLNITNIIAQYLPELKNRILLFAHWDTRPYADRDTKSKAKPIDGANDGGSGVGVLLEIARQIHSAPENPHLGIDIIFFDAEDYGQPQETMQQQQGNTWCLGSQYWSRNIHTPGYHPKYGILLDMVGAKDAVFPMEHGSMTYAPHVVKNVWRTAERLGYGRYFINKQTFGGLTDDHLYVNTIARIPSIDIVHYDPDLNDFGPFHHRHSDNMDIIDKSTLKAVGQTVLQVIYSES